MAKRAGARASGPSDLNLEGLPLALVGPASAHVLAFDVNVCAPLATLQEDDITGANDALAGALLLPNLEASTPAAVLVHQAHHVALDVKVATLEAFDVDPITMADLPTSLLLNGQRCPRGTDSRPGLHVLRILLGVEVVSLGAHEEDGVPILDDSPTVLGLGLACGLLLGCPQGNGVRHSWNPLWAAAKGCAAGAASNLPPRFRCCGRRRGG
mmetsp:Transcript_56172/g.130807  ORF Transcript_56172/g.130807 Transcript_56172/m.130807 type:complete len:212 (+) Transcript_56172:77-712(+)